MDFLNSNMTNTLLMFNIYDVDEFVIREAKRVHNYDGICDLSNVKRYSFEMFQVGEDEFYEEEMSTEEYLQRKDDGECYNCYTRLNYDDFESEFPLDELEHWYDDDWLYSFHCNKAFFQAVNVWIDKTDGDSSKKLRLQDLINKLKRSQLALSNIRSSWKTTIPLNAIQVKVIKIHKRFNEVMLKEISARYSPLFPDLFPETSKGATDSSYEVGFKLSEQLKNRKEILDLLIEHGFLKQKTSKADFIIAFNPYNNNKIKTPLVWVGSRNTLNYFVKTLVSNRIIDTEGKRYQKHWKYAEAVFRDSQGNKITNLSRDCKISISSKKRIDLVIRSFYMV